MSMDATAVEALFTGPEGYHFARWGRPLAPIAFGIADESLGTVKGAIEAVAALANLPVAETDPELGANLMLFFVRGWDELLQVPDLDRLVPGLTALVPRLKAAEAARYRGFRFDKDGAIMAAFCFLNMAGPLAEEPAEQIGLVEAASTVLAWADGAFGAQGPLEPDPESGTMMLRADIAGVIRAAYDPVMPAAANDAAHALRLAARLA